MRPDPTAIGINRVPVSRSTTVLVVEDDISIRRMMLAALESEGYGVSGAADTTEALTAIRERRPDLIITDYHLPGADGLELLRALQTEGFGDIPALVISADVRPPDVPANSFISKPFDLDSVLRAVRRALGRTDQSSRAIPQPRLAGFGWVSWLGQPVLVPA